MWNRAKNWLSLVADFLQLVGFFGVSPATVVALAAAAAAWFGNIRPFYAIVGTVCVFGAALYLLRSLSLRIGSIGMSDAARSAYEELRGTLWAEAAHRLGVDATPDGILDYLATGLSTYIPVYGKYPPSTRLEKIPEAEVKRGNFAHGATVLELRDGRGRAVTELKVRRRDLWAAVKRMKDSTQQFNS